MSKLGVNIDHVATLRQARREFDPDPITAAKICEQAGADSIVAHLREDRRHINDQDIRLLKRVLKTKLNLEMSLNTEIVRIATNIKPDQATLVPEKREEITTEGGLDVTRHFQKIKQTARILRDHHIEVSLFIDPVKEHIKRTKDAGVDIIELHTGRYDRLNSKSQKNAELKKIKALSEYAHNIGLTVNAGHGLKYHNTRAIACIPFMNELNIGHAIISRAVFVGLQRAVKEMIKIVRLK